MIQTAEKELKAGRTLKDLLDELLEARRFIAAHEAKSFDEAAYMCRVEDAIRSDIEALLLTREEADVMYRYIEDPSVFQRLDGEFDIWDSAVEKIRKLSARSPLSNTEPEKP